MHLAKLYAKKVNSKLFYIKNDIQMQKIQNLKI